MSNGKPGLPCSRKWIFVLHILLLVGATPSLAQDDPIPDTLDWHGYYPLQIGNAWEYVDDNYPMTSFPKYRYEEIVGDSVIDDRTYFVFRELYYDTETESVDTLAAYRRYDESHRTVVELSPRDNSEYPIVLCSFDVPFPPDSGNYQTECKGADILIHGGYSDHFLRIGPDSVHVKAVKAFCLGGPCTEFHFGVGDVGGPSEGGQNTISLRYLRIDGTEYGNGSVILSAESPTRSTEDAGISLYPNPVSAVLTIEFASPFSVGQTISIYDVLGRRMWTAAYTAGDAREFRVDVRPWAPGVYVAQTSSGRATLRSKMVIVR